MPSTLANADALLFRQLAKLGAGDFEHLNGTLEQHFVSVRATLVEWGADQTLCRAGLFHAAYGTAGFTPMMISLDRRREIGALIGLSAERSVYTYCACDRRHVWPQIGTSEMVVYRDRFTGEERPIFRDELLTFCELTCANEIEIALRDADFLSRHGSTLGALFGRWNDLLSAPASEAVQKVFGAPRR